MPDTVAFSLLRGLLIHYYGAAGASPLIERALSYLGSIKAHLDEHAEAVEMLTDAERVARSAGRFRETFNSLFFRAHALGNRGDLSEALRCFQTLRSESDDAGIGHYESTLY